jgi:type IV pilus assembly protein PilA
MSTWYFVDRGQNRQGPVDADALVEALRQGQVDFNSLVWREGLAQWAPLGQFIAELNLPVPNLPTGTPASPATAVPTEKKAGGCGVVAIVAVCVGLVLIVVLGILAAIALPAYQDYIVRSKVTAAHYEALATRFAVDEFVLNTDRCPRDAAELQLAPVTTPGVAALEVGEANTGMCTIEVEMAADFGGGRLMGQRLRHSRDSAGDWYCTSDSIPDKYMPADCR